MFKNKAALQELKDYLMIAIGTLIYTGGVSMFMLPYQLTTGGVSGVASIIYYISHIPVSLSYGVINCFFLMAGIKILGWRFCVKTIFGVAACTFWYWVWSFFEDPATGHMPQLCGDQTFMACILGAMAAGFGLSICFENNGSTGGTDIVAACVNKYKDISLGQVIMLCDVLIISSCYFVFHDVERVIFGYVMMVVCSMTLDFCIRRQHQAVEFKIYSRNYSMIADEINRHHFGVTVLDGVGWYTKTERKVLICVCSRRYRNIILRAIKQVDPFCFVSMANISSVYGEGFSTMKTKIKNQKPVIVFSTDNLNKLAEARMAIGERFEVRSLKHIGCRKTEIPKIKTDNLKNTKQEAEYVHKYYGFDCFADNTKDGELCIVLIYKGEEKVFNNANDLYGFLMQS